MDAIETKVREAFDLGRQKNMDGCWRLIMGLTVEHGAEPVQAAMWAVDPERLVWDSPVRPGETGLHGYPMAQNRYTFCSNIYGHHIDLPEGKWDKKFVNAVRRGYDNGNLHGNGYLVVDKQSQKLAFLVVVALSDDTVLSDDVLAEISARHGVTVCGLAYPNVPYADGSHLPGYACITAQLDSLAQLALADDLAVDITQAEVQYQAAHRKKATP